MTNYFKATLTLLVFSILICAVSVQSRGPISVADYSATEYVYFTEVLSEDFYSKSSSSKKLVESVVKLNFEIRSSLGAISISSATGFSVAYDKEIDKSYVIINDHFCSSLEEAPMPGGFYYEPYDTRLSLTSQYNGNDIVILVTDPSKDLCLMLADGYIRPAVVASKNYNVKQMEKIQTIGAPAGIYPIILDSYIGGLASREIAGPGMEKGDPLYLLSDVALGGQSGSPIFNHNGRVIGVLFLSLNNHNGPIYGSVAIPLGDLNRFLDTYLIR